MLYDLEPEDEVGTDSTPSHSADAVGASAASITPIAIRKENSLRSPRFARDGDAVELVPTNNRRVQIVAEFSLHEFHQNIRPFAFIAGYKQQKLDPEDPANLEAAKIMANLHDALKAGNYLGHELRVFLVRILFCLFAEDTGIFPQPRQFELYLTNHTASDGSDLGTKLARLFEILNTPEDNKRQKHLEADLAEFPYVNGDLFKEQLKFADFNSDMRNALLAACAFRWEKISPAVFGSLFQEVMLAPERRQLGAHYTAEKNIMKVVRSLFLDDLYAELSSITGRAALPRSLDQIGRRSNAALPIDTSAQLTGNRRARLDEFHDKLAKLTFFDPACGCGNFLVITYRELRALELDILKLKFGKQTEMKLDEVNKLSTLDVDQMFGIEIEEFPARIAEVALWLTDHQANMELSIAFTQRYLRIPLRKSPHIHVGNALRMDWKQVITPEKCSYILGNPPFVGKAFQTVEQKIDMENIWGDVKGSGILDYVTCWHRRSAEYIQGTKISVGLVSTNSISQGEQVSALWGTMLQRYSLKIHFAHRTFPWESEARGKAHVHVVIIGFGAFDRLGKRIFDYETEAEHATVSEVPNISPYLLAGSDVVALSRSEAICNVPPIVFGSMPNDGGHLLLSEDERKELLAKEPDAKQFVRRFVGSEEFINGIDRWCLWLVDASPKELREMPELMKRVEGVREHRNNSARETTRNLGATPTLFGEIRQPAKCYLIIPSVSSENRPYIPMDFAQPSLIASNLVLMVPGATNFHFGVLTSAIHMAWVRQVCGRLKSDYRYSNRLVYNNFPWPQTPSDAQKAAVEKAAQAVLDARAQFMQVGTSSTSSHSADTVGASAASITPTAIPKENSLRSPRSARDGDEVELVPTKQCTLADLYDPVAMPPALSKAHTELDRAVDRCYRKEPFPSDRARVEFLFQLYEQLTAPLLPATKQKRAKLSKAIG